MIYDKLQGLLHLQNLYKLHLQNLYKLHLQNVVYVDKYH